MAYISVNLGPTDPSPGNYSLYINPCGTGSTQQLIATGLTNPDSFPYYFETTDYSGTSGSTCITYELIDTITNCSCTGDVSLITPTPTISLTPTPTPSTTPLGGVNSDYITLGGYIFQNGTTTSFDLNAFSKYNLTGNVDIDLDITLRDTSRNTYTETVTLTIQGRTKTNTIRVDFNSIPYRDLDFSYILIENYRSSRPNDVINIHGDYVYGPSDDGPQGPQYITHRFMSCCSHESIFANVPQEQTEPNGWVYNGNTALYNGLCWVSMGPAPGTPVVTFMGPYSQNCSTSTCQDLCNDSYTFSAKVKACCPPYESTFIYMSSDSYPPGNTPSTVYFNGTMTNGTSQIDPGCYEMTAWQPVNVSTGNIHDVEGFYSSCEACTNYNISPNDPCTQTQNIWQAVNCCDPNDIIYATLQSNLTVNLQDYPGFTHNGSCYVLQYTIQSQEPTIFVTSNNFIHANICQSSLCPDCPSPTPTPTPSTTPVPWTVITRNLELVGCCDNVTYTSNITINVETVVNDYVYISTSSSDLTSGCYRVISINNQSSISSGTIQENYGQSSCTPCLNQYPCLQKYTGCTDSCSVVSYPYDTAQYTSSDGIIYDIPLVITEPAHLSPLANEDGVVTDDAWLAMVLYWFTVDNPCDYIPWVCDQISSGDNDIGTEDLLTLLSVFGSLESTINEAITCPSVYTQGLSPVLNDIYYVPQEDNCYEYVGEVNDSGQAVIDFSIDTSYTGCTDCIDTMIPTPTPTSSVTPTPSVTPSLTPSVTPTVTPSVTVTPSSTPTQFIYKVLLSGCCDNSTYLTNVQFTSQISQVNDTFFWQGDNTQNLIPQCYTILNFEVSTDEPAFTINNDTPYSDCEACLVDNPCNSLFKAIPCCEVGLEPIFVTVNDTNLPILGYHGLVYNHNCYVFSNGGGTGVGVITVTSDDYLPNICTDVQLFEQYCDDCQQPTPSPTPSVTTTPSSSVTPSVTATPTPSVTTTPTPSITPTPTPTSYVSQSNIQIERCCDGVVVGTVTVQFLGSTTSLSVGDAFVYNTVPYTVVSITSTESPYTTFELSDSDIFTGESDNCIQAIQSQEDPCKTSWYSGCTTGNVYLGVGDYSYYNTGTFRYGPDVFGDYGDYCVEVIENGTYSTYTTVVVNNPLVQINNCCQYPSSTPTPTPTVTPTVTSSTTPTLTPTPSITQTPAPEAVQCGDDFTINTTSFSQVLNPDGTITSYSPNACIVNGLLNLSSCEGTVKFAIRTYNLHDRIIMYNSNDDVVLDTLYIGYPQGSGQIGNYINQGPYTCNVFDWSNENQQLSFVGTESVSVSVNDFPYHSDSGNFTYPLYNNTWDDNGTIRYGAVGQIGGSLEYYDVDDGLTDTEQSNCGGLANTIPNYPYAACGGSSNNSPEPQFRIFTFDKPAGDPFYTIKVYGTPWNSNPAAPTAFEVLLLECPSC